MKRQYAFLSLTLGTLLTLGTAGCGNATEADTTAIAAPPRDLMTIKPEADLLSNLEIGEPKLTSVTGSLRVTGRVEANESRQARVSSPVTGRITDLAVLEGQVVKRGQLIAIIHSTELSAAQSTYLKVLTQLDLSKRAVDRAKHLLEAGVIGEAELQRREGELSQSQAEYSANRDQLSVLGMSDDAVHELETSRVVNAVSQVRASIDGTVMDRPVTQGQMVQSAETICVVADLSSVWLVADVPEQTAGTLGIGKTVEAEIAAFPGEIIRGQLTFVSAIVNPETRTVRARMDLANSSARFKPAMLATLTLQDLAETQRVIPATAVVREGNEEFLFVRRAEDTFTLRQVSLGGQYGDVRVLLDGLHEGEQIVLDGAFHLNNERKRAALQGS